MIEKESDRYYKKNDDVLPNATMLYKKGEEYIQAFFHQQGPFVESGHIVDFDVPANA